MKLRAHVFTSFLLVTACLLVEQIAATGRCTRFSIWMASSIISRGQGVLTGQGDSSELLQAGFTQKAFRRLIQQYPLDPCASHIENYIKKSVDSVVMTVINSTANTAYPLDRLSTGNNLIFLFEETGNATYRDSFEALRQSIDLQLRNVEGGLFYYVYPNWSYLDGMYSLTPFYTLYTDLYDAENTSTVINDICLQLDLLWDHCRLNASGLLVHGYDESRTAVWADPVTGRSPHVWSRSLGWYLMALVDTLELLPRTAEQARQHLQARFKELAAAVVSAVDENSGAWWQVLDQPAREGNYIESSGSAMFTYSLLKGIRLGYLEDEPRDNRSGSARWTHVATRAFEYMVDNFVVDNRNGTIGYNGTVSVCSLNSTASYEYYIGRPILYNSVLGSSAFVLASLEYEILLAGLGK